MAETKPSFMVEGRTQRTEELKVSASGPDGWEGMDSLEVGSGWRGHKERKNLKIRLLGLGIGNGRIIWR